MNGGIVWPPNVFVQFGDGLFPLDSKITRIDPTSDGFVVVVWWASPGQSQSTTLFTTSKKFAAQQFVRLLGRFMIAYSTGNLEKAEEIKQQAETLMDQPENKLK